MSMHIVAFTGSLREQSYNRAALEIARELLSGVAEVEIVSLADLPLYNQDLEKDEPEAVRRFKDKVRQADAILIATPEFNFSIPGVLKNAIDWASRPTGQSVLKGKPTAILGVGGRMGTARAQQHLRQILEHLQADVLRQPEVYIPFGWEKFTTEGVLVDEETRSQIQTLLQELVAAVEEPVYEMVS